MAPLSNEPDTIRVVFDMPKRKIFHRLVVDVTAYMRSQLEFVQPQQQSKRDVYPPPPHYTEVEELRGHRHDAPVAGPAPVSGYQRGDDDSNARLKSPRRSSSGSGSGSGSTSSAPPSAALVRLRRDALVHFDVWRKGTLGKLKEVLSKADDETIIDARRRREEAPALKHPQPTSASSSASTSASASKTTPSEDLLIFNNDNDDTPPPTLPPRPALGNIDSDSNSSAKDEGKSKEELEALQRLYHPIPTKLSSLPLRDREEVLSATLLLLLSTGTYSAYSRVLANYLASALGIPPSALNKEEMEIATTMVETAQKADADADSQKTKNKAGKGAREGMSAEAEAQKRREEGRTGRLWKVGLASVAGAAIVGVTGGLAAPVVAAAVGGLMTSVGLGGLASFLGIFWMNGALVGTLFGAFGAKMTGEIVDRYAKEVEDFRFIPLHAERRDRGDTPGAVSGNGAEARRLRVTIGINGWLDSEDDVTRPWRALSDDSEVFALRYEMSCLMSLGQQLRELVGSAAWNAVRLEILKRTVLATVQGALWPIFLLRSASSLDNPFSLARNRSEKAGQVLADALINKVQGERPVTLIGYSLGARVIYSCLRVLAEKRAFGLVDTVVLIGAPVPSNFNHWQMMRSVVAGKLFNVHSENDYILGFLYRSTSLQLGIAGLQSVGEDIDGVEDLDLSQEVHGHLRYPKLIAQILHRCGFLDVKGGDAAIEEEKEPQTGPGEIDLRDKNNKYIEIGQLIDIGEDDKPAQRPQLPPRRRDTENEKFDTVVKDVGPSGLRPTERDSPNADAGSGGEVEEQKKATQASTRSAPDLLQNPSLSSPAEPNTIEQRAASVNYPVSSFDRHRLHIQNNHYDDDDDDDDDDEDGYGRRRITMVDYDDLSHGELTMVEPLSIDDDDEARVRLSSRNGGSSL